MGLEKAFESIDTDDILELIEDGVTEGRRIEYKAELPGKTDSERKEFLADVSSLANSDGGHILFGVPELREDNMPTGIPNYPVGLEVQNFDQLRNRLESSCRDGIEPRISGLQFRVIDGFEGGSVVLLRVPRSWTGPHIITYQHWCRIYGRSNGGKYIMDWDEIRRAFLGGSEARERISEFRMNRLSTVLAGETPVTLEPNGAKVVIHLIPLSMASQPTAVNVADGDLRTFLRPLNSLSYNALINFDGLVTFAPTRTSSFTYTLLTRSGAIEGVDTDELRDASGSITPSSDNVIGSLSLERTLISALDHYIAVMRRLDIAPPWILFVSMFGISGYKLGVRTASRARGGQPLDRSSLHFPEQILDGESNGAAALQPIFDMLWQAFGFSHCEDYDQGATL